VGRRHERPATATVSQVPSCPDGRPAGADHDLEPVGASQEPREPAAEARERGAHEAPARFAPNASVDAM
jgi:hypothetical protein